MDKQALLTTKLQIALDHGGNTHSVEDVFEALESGQMQMLWKDNSGIVTMVSQYPRKRAMTVFLVFGDMDEAMTMQPQLVQMAKDMGCEFIEMSGRVGWSKVLPKYGWHKTGISHALPIMEINHG